MRCRASIVVPGVVALSLTSCVPFALPDALVILTALPPAAAAIVIPNLLVSRVAANESSGIAHLRAYCTAQAVFRRHDWDGDGELEYASDFTHLYRLPNDRKPHLIDRAFAEASSRERPKAGYWYQDLKTRADGKPYDYKKEFGLIARPAIYDKTGRNTFVIDESGAIYHKDCGPQGYKGTQYPDLKDGWLPIGGGAAPARPGPGVERGRPRRPAVADKMAANESAVIANLRAYVTAQHIFRRTDWDGDGVLEWAPNFTHLYRLPNGREPHLIDLAFARATSQERRKFGYWFQDLKTYADGKAYDHRIEFGLITRPAVYGDTGRATFVVDGSGAIYQKDCGPEGYKGTQFPDLKVGWTAVGTR